MACAAVSSLLDTLEQLVHTPNLNRPPSNREQIVSLQRKFTFFEEFLLQSYQFNDDEFVRRTKMVIKYLASKVEDYIAEILFNGSVEAGELENRHQILNTQEKAKEIFEEIDYIEKEVLGFCGEADNDIQLLEEDYSVESLSLPALSSGNAFDETFLEILDRVTGLPLKLQILAIVGMRSMGKTALAKRIFDNQFVLHHFYIRAWITVSKESPIRYILLGLLKCIQCTTDDGIYEKSEGQLAELLFRSLKGQRYLIVIDNLWCTKVWNAVKRSFPDDQNGSRILLTSCLMNLGIQVHSNRSSHDQHFPSAEDTWKIFQEMFSEDCDPLQLIKIGEQVTREHQGLFLAIILAAGILAKISDTPNYWGDFMQNAGSFMDESVKDIFTLNFNQLPHYLRTCFSYVGVLPDDCEIFLYIIIRVWNVLGLVRPERLKRLEEVAKVHFEDLVENTQNVNKIRWSDCRVKRNFIPDLLWHLNCTSAQKEKFLDLITKGFKFVSVFTDHNYPLSFSSDIDLCIWLRPVVPLTRSFQCFGVEEWFQPKKNLYHWRSNNHMVKTFHIHDLIHDMARIVNESRPSGYPQIRTRTLMVKLGPRPRPRPRPIPSR
ncbi:hypothetical protein M9H77_25362 [Catharanthus roseus]|uniref:Uncharacterized protein n=1 Tax=Catharanthus roseus TaxID=4058 RepID=A0ACC0A7H8_CATRO|nr:hypothetical protein M9H77_25362 [Catharanthus roseus]